MASAPSLQDRSAVYIVRPGENEELRYSLRSLEANFPHRDVWIVGSCLPWLRNVNRIELEPQPEKWANIDQSLAAICAEPGISDDFVVFNDDIFVTEPLDALPVWHLGRLDEYVAELGERYDPAHTWFRAVCRAYEQLCEWGYPDAFSYEAHIPMQFNRTELGALLEASTHRPLAYACLYSATSGPAGFLGENIKVAGMDSRALTLRLAHDRPFLSTSDAAFADGAVGEFIRDMFPNPSRYEAA